MVNLLELSIVLIAMLVVIRLLFKGRSRVVSAPPEEEIRCLYCEVMEEHHKASTHGVTEEQYVEHEQRVLRKAKAAGFGALVMLLVMKTSAHAQFGGSIVFDPNMFARQLHQLQEEIATVKNLAEQVRYMIKNTTGGGGGAWRSNENLLANLGGIISEQQGLSYSASNLIQQFQQLYPGFQAPAGAPAASPQMSLDTALNTLNGTLQSVQMQANNFQAEQLTLSNLEMKNNAAIGALQAVQTGNEVALAEAQQIQELRQLTMSAQNAQTLAAAAQVNAQVESVETAQAMIGAPAQIHDATDIPTNISNLPGTN